MSTLQEYLGTITIDDDSKDFTLERNDGTNWGPTAAALTVGDYFLHGYSGEATDQLCEHLQDVIRNTGPGGQEFTTAEVTYSYVTGLVSIDLKTTGEIVWDGVGATDTDLRDLLGFTSNLTASSAWSGDNQPKAVWRPTLGLSSYPGDLTRFFGQRSTSRIGVSSDGTTYSNPGTILYDGIYGYSLLSESEVITDSATVWESLEQFWEDCIHTGKPVRVKPDRTVYTSSSYHTVLMSNTDGKIGGFHDDMISRWAQNTNHFWSPNFQMRKHVT